MSYESVYNAIAPLLRSGIEGLVTVADASEIDAAVQSMRSSPYGRGFVAPNLCPAVLLKARPLAESPLSLGFAADSWYLDCTIWCYELPAQRDLLNDAPLRHFRRLVQQLEAVCRANLAAGNVADDPGFGTKVLVSGREMQKQDYPALPIGMGQVVRRARRSPLIREIAQIT